MHEFFPYPPIPALTVVTAVLFISIGRAGRLAAASSTCLTVAGVMVRASWLAGVVLELICGDRCWSGGGSRHSKVSAFGE